MSNGVHICLSGIYFRPMPFHFHAINQFYGGGGSILFYDENKVHVVSGVLELNSYDEVEYSTA